jgi:hypothetical protein
MKVYTSNTKLLTCILYVLLAGSLAIVVLSMVSCQKMDVQLSDPNKVVVKGYLYAGRPVSISITKQLLYGATDTITHPIENLEVVISDSKSNTYPLLYTSNGVYKQDKLLPQVGETYTLKFTYNGKEISATTTVPAKPSGFQGSSSISVQPFGSTTSGPPSMSRAEYSWTNTNSSYFLMVVESITPKATPINDTTEYEALPAFRISPTQGNSQNFMGRSFYYYGAHNVILFAINQEYVDLYEDTGNSSQNITTPPGNITNGYGIFTAINADTLRLNVTP